MKLELEVDETWTWGLSLCSVTPCPDLDQGVTEPACASSIFIFGDLRMRTRGLCRAVTTRRHRARDTRSSELEFKDQNSMGEIRKRWSNREVKRTHETRRVRVRPESLVKHSWREEKRLSHSWRVADEYDVQISRWQGACLYLSSRCHFFSFV